MAATKKDILNMLDTTKHRPGRRRVFSAPDAGFVDQEPIRISRVPRSSSIEAATQLIDEFRAPIKDHAE